MTNIEQRIPVVLYIRSQQIFDGVEPDGTELVTEGWMTPTEKGLELAYDETELTGMEGTTTTFQVEGDRVILVRSGTTCSQMVFQEGTQHTSLYETRFGDLSMDIQTSYLRHNLTERGGVMEIRYSIAVEHAVTGRNQFKIRVKPKLHA